MNKNILLLTLLLLSITSCTYFDTYYIPPRSYYMNMDYNEITSEIYYYEWKLARKSKYNYYGSREINYIEKHLRNLYLYRNYIRK